MTHKELEAKAREIKEYQRIAEEAADAAEALRDDIKAAMAARYTAKTSTRRFCIN